MTVVLAGAVRSADWLDWLMREHDDEKLVFYSPPAAVPPLADDCTLVFVSEAAGIRPGFALLNSHRGPPPRPRRTICVEQ